MQLPPSSRSIRFCLVLAVAAVLTGPASAATLLWDSNAETAPGGLDGAGSWNITTQNWYNSSTPANSVWNNSGNDIAAFGNGGTGATVNLATTITAGGLLFNSGITGNYTLTGATLLLNTGSTITSNAAGTTLINIATIQNPTGGNPNGILTVDGTGDINFTSAIRFLTLTYAGTGTITLGGTADNANLGLIVNSGTVILAKTNSASGHATGGGGMIVASGGTVKIAGAGGDQIYDGGQVTLNGTLDLAGLSEGVGRMNGSGLVTNTSATAATFTIGTMNQTGLTFAGVIKDGTGALSLAKVGTGIQTLSGKNEYTGTTSINGGGTLGLDFTALADGVPVISSASALVLNGVGTGNGTLAIAAKNGATTGQTFNGLTLNGGASLVTVTPGTATGFTTDFGAITRVGGGTLDLTTPTGVISYASSTGTASQLLTASGVAFLTVGGNDWAAKDATNTKIVGLSTLGGYTGSTATALAGNADVATGVNTTLSSDTSITSLRVNVNESRSIFLSGATSLTTGGILVSSTVNTGSGTFITGGTLMGAAGQDLVIVQNSAKNLTIGSVIANNGTATGLTKSGPGALVLTGTNTYTGATFVGSGTLQIGNGGTTGTIGSGTVTVNSVLAFNRSDALTISANIAGTGGFSQIGSGTTTLSGANTITGSTSSTTVAAGTLLLDYTTNSGKLGDSGALILAGGTVRLNNGTHTEVVASTTFNAGASAVTRGLGTAKLRFNVITRGVAGGTVDFSAAGVADADTANTAGILGGYATVAGADWAFTGTTAGDTNITALAAGSYTAIAASGSDTNNSLLSGTGALTASLVTNSLKITTSGSGQSLSLGSGTLTLTSGGLLFTGGADYSITTGTLRGLASRDLIVHQYGTGNLTIGAVIADNTAATGLTKSGTGTLTLTGTNTFTGQTFLNAGTLSISANNQLGAVATGAAINMSGGTLLATATFALDNGSTAKRGVTLNAAGGTFAVTSGNTLTISGVVSGIGGFTKSDAGTLVLSGTNTYTGQTNVTAGALQVTGSIAGSITSVTAAGTVAGTGTIGDLNVGNGGTVSPGAPAGGAGQLSTGSLSLTSGGTVKLELGSTASYDKLNVTGTVDLGGSTFSLSLLGGSSIAPNDLFFVIVNDGTDAIANPFAGLAEGSQISAGANTFTVTYAANSTGNSFTGGNDMALLAVPEPGSLAGLFLGGLLLGARRFRRERSTCRYVHS